MLLPGSGVTMLLLLSLRHPPPWKRPFTPEKIASQAVKMLTTGLFSLQLTHKASGKAISPTV